MYSGLHPLDQEAIVVCGLTRKEGWREKLSGISRLVHSFRARFIETLRLIFSDITYALEIMHANFGGFLLKHGNVRGHFEAVLDDSNSKII